MAIVIVKYIEHKKFKIEKFKDDKYDITYIKTTPK